MFQLVNNEHFFLLLIFLYLLSMLSVLLVRISALKIGNSVAVISSIFAFILAALRPINYPDYAGYVNIFDNASSGDFANSLYWASHSEPGFKIISYVVSFFGFDYLGLMILMSALSLVLLMVTARIANVRFAFLWFTYFSIYFITRDLALIRLAISSHLIVISIIKTRLYGKLIYTVLASFIFQYFSFIATFATIFIKTKLNIKIFIILLFIALIFAYFINFENISTLVPEKQLQNYAGTEHVLPGYVQVIRPFIRNLFYAIILYWFMRNQLDNKIIRSIVWLSFLSSLSYIAFSGILLIAYRFSAYFAVVFPLGFALVLNQSNISNLKFIFIYILMIFSFITNFYINNYLWL